MQVFEKVFERELTELDWKQNIPFKVDVPAGVTHLKVELEYTPHKVGGYYNMLTLTIFDPQGWRGSGHRHSDHHQVVLGAEDATPGYRTGPVQPGMWEVGVDTHMIMPGAPVAIKLSIRGDNEPLAASSKPRPAGKTASRGPGWYRGDLHAHTVHSDARWDAAGLLAFARKHTLDFTTLSDHNTVAGLDEVLASTSDDLLTMGGMELTTFRGHALALGIHHWVDWRVRPGQRSMEQAALEVTAEGGVFIIAHPMSPGDPYCTGCDWRFRELMPGVARAVEVWNMDWLSEVNNEDALALVTGWLNDGCRLALTAGADNHGEMPDLAYGFNVVYASDLTEAAILQGIAAGHLYLSSGPRLDLRVQAGGQTGMMGDSLDVKPGETAHLSAAWEGSAVEDAVALVVDGVERLRLPAGEQGRRDWEIAGGQAHWCMLTLRDAQGVMRALSNPIYLDGRS